MVLSNRIPTYALNLTAGACEACAWTVSRAHGVPEFHTTSQVPCSLYLPRRNLLCHHKYSCLVTIGSHIQLPHRSWFMLASICEHRMQRFVDKCSLVTRLKPSKHFRLSERARSKGLKSLESASDEVHVYQLVQRRVPECVCSLHPAI